MKGWEVASLAELESLPGPGTLRWTPVRRHFGITAYGINAYTAGEAGQDVVEEHSEERLGHEELYLVVSGSATFVLDGEEVAVPADPDGMRRLADLTGGTAFEAASADQLRSVYDDISGDVSTVTEQRELAGPFLMAAVVVLSTAFGASLLWTARFL